MRIKGMKARALGILVLLTIALGITAAVYASGAANQLLPSSGKTFLASSRVSPTNPNEIIMTIWIDGELYKNLTLPKGNYIIQTENGALTVVPGQAPPNMDEAVKIAEADQRVQSLTKDQPYQFNGATTCPSPQVTSVTLHLVVGTNAYYITVNLTKQSVISIEPAPLTVPYYSLTNGTLTKNGNFVYSC